MESKQTLLFRIYQVLEECSDENHPLTQQGIIDILHNVYDVDCERRAVGRNIAFLRECGVEVYSDKRGSFLVSRKFENAELRLLIDGVMSSKYISNKQSQELANKLSSLGSKYFKSRVKHIYTVNDWNKAERGLALYNIDYIDEAIERGKKLIFNYCHYDTDLKLVKSHHHIVSPYQLILHKQNYYLFCYEEYWHTTNFLRLDKMNELKVLDENATPLSTLKGYEKGINYNELTSCYPYMFGEKPERVEFVADRAMTDQIVDWFGTSATITEIDKNTINVKLSTNLKAMECWAMQFSNYVEIKSPQTLRDTVKANLQNALTKYNN